MYFIKAFVGPGCLSLPLAFQNAGLGLGLGTLLVLAVGVTHNLRSLILCKRFYEGASTYADVAECAVGPRAKRGVSWTRGVHIGVAAPYPAPGVCMPRGPGVACAPGVSAPLRDREARPAPEACGVSACAARAPAFRVVRGPSAAAGCPRRLLGGASLLAVGGCAAAGGGVRSHP